MSRSCGKLSDYFDSSVGVKQGEPLSPLLFSLFSNYLADDLRVITDISTFDESFIEDFRNLYYYSQMILYSWLRI